MIRSDLQLGFDPLLPLHWLIALMGAALLLLLWSLFQKQRGALWRMLAALLLIALLANPQVRREKREVQADIGLIVVDGSASMRFDDRGNAARAAAVALKARAPANLTWRVVTSGGPTRSDVFAALERGRSTIAPELYAGAVLITDGLVHDAPASTALQTHPINVMIAGKPDVVDRKLRITSAPAFAIIGQSAQLQLTVEDGGTEPVAVTLSIADAPDRTLIATPGQIVTVPFTLKRRGAHDITLKVAPRGGDILPSNDVALVRVQGVRERLNVLLVTGSPYPGARLWRDTLKADSTIDLIHFTILRTPYSVDAASNVELALIPFPVEQLFEQRLSSFDLVIFDRYTSLDLLQPAYFAAVASYVRSGGALLVVAGPEYNGAESLANTPLQSVLPLLPRGQTQEAEFVPSLTAIGARHPVTASLQKPWGPWYRFARTSASTGRSLLQTPSGDPLLHIASAEKGRVAMLLSDQLWLWARADAPGPWNDLVRRTAHWLMKEPDLESEQLELRRDGANLRITHRSDSSAPVTAQVTKPDGTRESLSLNPDGSVAAPTPGLYRVRSGSLERSINTADAIPELRNARPNDKILAPIAKASGGALGWLKDGVPTPKLKANNQGRLIGFDERPLLPAWAWLFLLSGALALSWLREADRLRR
jgi:hypothetical protein